MSNKNKTPTHVNRLSFVILVVLFSWTYTYNIFIKKYDRLEAFLKIIDTISDDFVLGSILTPRSLQIFL